MNTKWMKYEGLAEVFKSIGHPARVAILDLLSNCPNQRLTVKNIYEKLKLEQPIASRHLNIMRKCGILSRSSEGGNIFYCLCTNDSRIECILTCFKSNFLANSMQLST